MSVSHSPTVRRRRLGMELRRLRESSGLMIEDVARHLDARCRASAGSRPASPWPASATCATCSTCTASPTTASANNCSPWPKRRQQRGWWTEYEAVLSAGLDTYVGLEASAASIRSFQTHLVPGLLQTEEYSRALIKVGQPGESPANIDRMISLRRSAGRRCSPTRTPEMWAVLDEAVLRRADRRRRRDAGPARPSAGGRTNCQRDHSGAARSPAAPIRGSTVRSRSSASPTRPISTSSTSIHPAGNIFLEKERDVRRHTTWFDHLRAAALPPDESTDFIATAADDFKNASPYPRG